MCLPLYPLGFFTILSGFPGLWSRLRLSILSSPLSQSLGFPAQGFHLSVWSFRGSPSLSISSLLRLCAVGFFPLFCPLLFSASVPFLLVLRSWSTYSPLPSSFPSVLRVPSLVPSLGFRVFVLRSSPSVLDVIVLALLWCGCAWFLVVFLPRWDLWFPSRRGLALGQVRFCWFFCLARGLEFLFCAGLSLSLFLSLLGSFSDLFTYMVPVATRLPFRMSLAFFEVLYCSAFLFLTCGLLPLSSFHSVGAWFYFGLFPCCFFHFCSLRSPV